ncbi:outer membrane protein insertion porin family [Candidatus Magnetomoraceae bacterium gMMP-1]
MLKRYFIFVFIFCLILTCRVVAEETINILIFPFNINTLEELDYLQNEIPKAIENILKEEGVEITDRHLFDNFSWEMKRLTENNRRKIGLQLETDHIIWGSFNKLGETFSLDIKMADTAELQPVEIFSAEGNRLETLEGILNNISRSIALRIFQREIVTDVTISGNERIESDAIKRIIKTHPGEPYSAKTLSLDIKSIFKMGYFDDVRVEADTVLDGKEIKFHVVEKPAIHKINIKSNRVFDDDEIKEVMNIKKGSIVNIFKIQENIKQIENMYKEKNYHNVKVTYKLHPREKKQANIDFIIKEGKKILIQKIIFDGNKAYKSKKLKKLMQTSEKGFFSWLTSSGELDQEKLNQDIAKLTAFYHNHGYIQAKLSEPKVIYTEKWINVHIKLVEGPQFSVGKIDIDGDLVKPVNELMKDIKIKKEKLYNREVLRKDVVKLTDIYSNEGYAYADVSPKIKTDMENLKVNITFEIEKGEQVYFDKIIISGNTKTRDKVIRRQLNVYEQELYSGVKLKQSVRNLNRLDFFETVKVDSFKGTEPDKMDLKIEVTEKPTGLFSFGGGYSSIDKGFIMGSVTQRNLFGRGQILEAKGQLGGTSTKFTLSFTEPWLFDIPLSAGVDAYNWTRDYDTYDKDSKGGRLRLGYKIWKYTRAYISYAYDISDITEIEEDASQSIKDLEGENTTSSITTSINYDSRDKAFNPTEGSDHTFSIEYAGEILGGNIAFTKYNLEVGKYFPLFWGTVGFLHGKGGYVDESSHGDLPDYERFYLGGINSLRGFDWQDIHVEDENGDEIGGDKYVQFNAEFIFPLLKDVGLMGLVFYDTGNVFDDENVDLGELRQSAGFGFRWYSPIGPIRLEHGYILDPEDGESSNGRWEFAMGSAF